MSADGTTDHPAGRVVPLDGSLPDVIVIGAMKCGTSALHRYLDAHPEVGMAAPKELNFFVGPARLDRPAAEWSWQRGNWHRGLAWYARQFPDAVVRGEASPAYTSPSFPEAATRMARIVPGVRLIYLVRDPLERAVSQYLHHRSDGTERRPLGEALVDPASQYVSRSCFHARLVPYLAHFPRRRIFICSREELLWERRATMRAVHRFLGVDERFWSATHEQPCPLRETPSLPAGLRARFAAHVAEDAVRLQELAGRQFPAWTI